MKKSILITGGARSGKSAIAERLVKRFGDTPVYIATAQVFDDEMKARVDAHIERRGADWVTVQEPLDLAGALRRSASDQPILVDCLTLWVTNLLLAEQDIDQATTELLETLSEIDVPVVFVTNEVGSGIVPDNKLARDFRDAAGQVNQRVAAYCDDVYLAVSGQALKVKPNDNDF